MDKGQSEVTNKIRSAIKEKLANISDFIDDELPEYIMILVANQRSKAQIEKDLNLFLRDDTVKFTDWLWELLNNLKVGSKSSHLTLPETDSNISERKDADEDAVVLDCDPDEREGDFLSSHEDTNDSVISRSRKRTVSDALDEVTREKASMAKSQFNYKSIEKDEPRLTEKSSKLFSNKISKASLSSTVVPANKQIINSDDEYDPTKPALENKSYSRNTQRKYGGAAALQANKLLLKAVDDATKSILHGKNIEDYYKPTPIKVLTSKRYRNPLPSKASGNLPSQSTAVCDTEKPDLNSNVSQTFDYNVQEFSDMLTEENYINPPVSPQRNRTICLRTIPLVPDISKFESEELYTPKITSEQSIPTVEEIRPKSPHFIVTLEGINLTSFKRKLDDNSIDSMEEDEENILSDEIEDTSPEKKLRLSERCKYWPACKNSDQCSYHHPTIPCKCFPDCKFGDKCLYIHPNCKFDALCSRKDCPFTHASKRKLPLTAPTVRMVPVTSRKIKTVCKFYPKCTSQSCPFIHPKLCRYGTDCRLPVCLYSHFPVPSRSQMKWQASVS